MEEFTISIYVNNKPGVLMRLSQTFARRGYNIDSLVVSPAVDHQFSRITVVVQGGPETLDQILRQLNKLVDVVHASHHDPKQSVERELAIFKLLIGPEKRSEVLQIVDVFRAKIVDITDQSLIVESTGLFENRCYGKTLQHHWPQGNGPLRETGDGSRYEQNLR